MPNGSDLEIVKLELVRDITIAYLTNVYPKPLAALTDDVRQKAVELHRNEIGQFIESIYTVVSKLKSSSK